MVKNKMDNVIERAKRIAKDRNTNVYVCYGDTGIEDEKRYFVAHECDLDTDEFEAFDSEVVAVVSPHGTVDFE